MVAWHHWLNGHEFEQAPVDGEGQGSLAYNLATEQYVCIYIHTLVKFILNKYTHVYCHFNIKG